jgi:hypothetical protein
MNSCLNVLHSWHHYGLTWYQSSRYLWMLWREVLRASGESVHPHLYVGMPPKMQGAQLSLARFSPFLTAVYRRASHIRSQDFLLGSLLRTFQVNVTALGALALSRTAKGRAGSGCRRVAPSCERVRGVQPRKSFWNCKCKILPFCVDWTGNVRKGGELY